MKNTHLFPIPREKLIERFQKPLLHLANNQSATILALPHTGRTSNLRFLVAEKNIIENLGLTKRKIIFIDIDSSNYTFISFISDLLNLLNTRGIEDNNLLSILASKDPYLITQSILKEVQEITNKESLSFIVTLNRKAHAFLSEIDNLFVQIQKSTSDFPISILWSLDTNVLDSFTPHRSSSTLGTKIFYYKTFDKEETLHSISRIAYTKGIKLTKIQKENAFSATAGIAGLFYPYLDFGDRLDESPAFEKNLGELKEEFTKNPDWAKNLTTQIAYELISSIEKKDHNLFGIKFTKLPTATDITLVKLFNEKGSDPISRDDIAKGIWKSAWQKNYSDWAIDKAIERLRRNISESHYKIITIRNHGYQLIKL